MRGIEEVIEIIFVALVTGVMIAKITRIRTVFLLLRKYRVCDGADEQRT